MKRIYALLASLLLLVSCDVTQYEVRDDLYEEKIMMIERNHEGLLDVTEVSEVIEILEAVKSGSLAFDGRTEMEHLKAEIDTASLRASEERLAKVTKVFIQRVGTIIQDMPVTPQESVEILSLTKSIRISNVASFKYDEAKKRERARNEAAEDSTENDFHLEQLFNGEVDYEELLESLSIYDENGDLDISGLLSSIGDIIKFLLMIAALFGL